MKIIINVEIIIYRIPFCKTQPRRALYTCSGMGSNLPRPLSANSTASSNVSGRRVWRVSGSRVTNRPEVMEIAPNIVNGNQPLTVFCNKGTTRSVTLYAEKSCFRQKRLLTHKFFNILRVTWALLKFRHRSWCSPTSLKGILGLITVTGTFYLDPISWLCFPPNSALGITILHLILCKRRISALARCKRRMPSNGEYARAHANILCP